jgi:KTSC domain
MRLINLAGSTLLAAIGYNYDTGVFVAQFHKTGKLYVYGGVTGDEFIKVITDPISQGKMFNLYIKGGDHPYSEVTTETVEGL